jgi:hypothetical protein
MPDVAAPAGEPAAGEEPASLAGAGAATETIVLRARREECAEPASQKSLSHGWAVDADDMGGMTSPVRDGPEGPRPAAVRPIEGFEWDAQHPQAVAPPRSGACAKRGVLTVGVAERCRSSARWPPGVAGVAEPRRSSTTSPPGVAAALATVVVAVAIVCAAAETA